jgi:hypothetical protein
MLQALKVLTHWFISDGCRNFMKCASKAHNLYSSTNVELYKLYADLLLTLMKMECLMFVKHFCINFCVHIQTLSGTAISEYLVFPRNYFTVFITYSLMKVN